MIVNSNSKILLPFVYSNDLENEDNKQGVSERNVHEVREYANTPQVFAESILQSRRVYHTL